MFQKAKSLIIEPSRRVPVAGILLIMINLMLFFGLQIDDTGFRKQAFQFYFSSGLYEMEREPYLAFMKRDVHIERYEKRILDFQAKSLSTKQIFEYINFDPFFQNYLKHYELFEPNSLAYWKWVKKRRELQRLLSKDSAFYFGFKPTSPDITNAVASLFLHKNIGYFLINMLFLYYTIALLKGKIGSFKILSIYLISGLIAPLTAIILVPDNLTPILATTCAVSGLMGAMTVAFGFKKIEIPYLSLRGFQTYSVNNLVVVGLWGVILTALFSYFANYIDAIANSCSFILGGLIVPLLNVKTKSNQIEKSIAEQIKEEILRAKHEWEFGNFNAARNILYPLHVEYPNHKEILFALFDVNKIFTASNEYHEVVEKIFALNDKSPATTFNVRRVFLHYMRRAQPVPKISLSTAVALLRRFRKAGCFDDAELLLKYFQVQKVTIESKERVSREHLLLARCYLDKHDLFHGYRLLNELIEIYPTTSSAEIARGLVI